jgi:FtsH-binding integral membrane protein
MMHDEPSNDERSLCDSGGNSARLDLYSVESDAENDDQDIQGIKARIAEISSAQIKLTVFTYTAFSVLSTATGFTVVAVWAWKTIHGDKLLLPMNECWWLLSLMLAPLSGNLILQIPERLPWKLIQRGKD